MTPLRSVAIISLLSLAVNLGYGQHAPVTWNCKMERIGEREWMLTMKAMLASGWHIYSQHLEEGGPIPTHIRVNTGDNYSLIGTAEEKGSAFRFYDSLYEMNITWYRGEVSFVQRISMNRMIPEISGTIQYMVCNDRQCIPLEYFFNVSIDMKN